MPENVRILLYAIILALCLIGTYQLFRKKQKQSVEIKGTTVEFSPKHREFIQHAPAKFLEQFKTLLEDANVKVSSAEPDLSVLHADNPDHETDIVITLSFGVNLPKVNHVEELKVLCHYLGHIEVLYVKNSSKVSSFDSQDIKKSLYLLGLIEDENE